MGQPAWWTQTVSKKNSAPAQSTGQESVPALSGEPEKHTGVLHDFVRQHASQPAHKPAQSSELDIMPMPEGESVDNTSVDTQTLTPAPSAPVTDEWDNIWDTPADKADAEQPVEPVDEPDTGAQSEPDAPHEHSKADTTWDNLWDTPTEPSPVNPLPPSDKPITRNHNVISTPDDPFNSLWDTPEQNTTPHEHTNASEDTPPVNQPDTSTWDTMWTNEPQSHDNSSHTSTQPPATSTDNNTWETMWNNPPTSTPQTVEPAHNTTDSSTREQDTTLWQSSENTPPASTYENQSPDESNDLMSDLWNVSTPDTQYAPAYYSDTDNNYHDNDEDNEQDTVHSWGKPTLITLLALAITAGVGVGGVYGYRAYQNHQHAVAVQRQKDAEKQRFDKAKDAYASARESAVVYADTVRKSRVASDGNVVKVLDEISVLVKEKEPVTVNALTKSAGRWDSLNAKLKTAFDTAMKALVSEKQNTFTNTLNNAGQVLAGAPDGDNKNRLQNLVNEWSKWKVTEDNLEQVDKATMDIEQAVNAVNADIQAKQQAEEAQRQTEAQAQAQAQAQQQQQRSVPRQQYTPRTYAPPRYTPAPVPQSTPQTDDGHVGGNVG